MALGSLRMSEQEYNDTTLRRLQYRIEGFFEVESRRERYEWERVRWQSALILQMFAKKGRKIKPQDITVFPWEKEAKTIPAGRKMSPEEIKSKFAETDKRMREKWQKTG